MIHPWLGIAVALATLGALAGLLRVAQRWTRLDCEVSRKIMHTGIGLVTLSFPWLFDRVWPVVLLAAIATAALLTIKLTASLRDGIGSIVMGVQRTSFGEVYFPLAVGVLFVLSFGDWKLFVIPMLILSLADALAALIGIRYGTLSYQTFDGHKSAEGSIAFFTVAFLSVHVPLLLWTQVDRPQTLLVALILGLLVMLLEAIAWRGLDNLFIPLGAFVFLKLYLDKPAEDLILRLGATILLVGFALCWRRRATLDDSALVGAALFGYAAWMLGGWLWLVAPLALFLIYVLAWPREDNDRYHTVYAVISVTSGGAVWLVAHAIRPNAQWLILPYSAAFAAHLAIIGVSQRAHTLTKLRRRNWLAGSILMGWGLGFMPLILVLWTKNGWSVESLRSLGWILAVGLAAVAVPAAAFDLLVPRLYRQPSTLGLVHVVGALLGLTGSVVAAIFVTFQAADRASSLVGR